MNNSNKIVHGLWIGSHLSIIELLCLQSFIDQGHEFHLWLYDSLETEPPKEVVVCDASLIIPRDKVFCYKYPNQFGHGKGSYAGFSDIFRYKLLYEKGGWWSDMDVICLKRFDFDEEYVFRNHHDFPVIGNIMKCPPMSELMKACYEEAVIAVSSENTNWNLPIIILNKHIAANNLNKHIKNFTNPDDWRFVRKLIYRKPKIAAGWYAIHLLNEEWRKNNMIKNGFLPCSFLGRLTIRKLPEMYSPLVFRNAVVNCINIIIPEFRKLQLAKHIASIKWFFVNLLWRSIRLIQRALLGKKTK